MGEEFKGKMDLLVSLLADGRTVEECTEKLCGDPHLVDRDLVGTWLRDPDLLQRAIDRSNDLIGQAWGTMWLNVKAKAMLGSIQHARLLIEFIQNNNRLSDNTLKILFDKAVAGEEVPEAGEDG